MRASVRERSRAALLRAATRLRLDAGVRWVDKNLRGDTIRVMVLHGTPATSAVAFERQLSWVTRHFDVLAPEELFAILDGRARRHAARPAIALTFDDGLASNAEVGAAVMESFGVRGIFFVCPAFAQQQGPAALRFFAERVRIFDEHSALAASGDYMPMSPAQLRSLRARGHVIGNHTMSHQNLAACPPEQLEHEIVASRDLLASWLGEPVLAFAWTFSWDAIAARPWALAAATHRYVFTACPGSGHRGPSCVWRTNVEPGLSESDVSFFYSGLGDAIWARRRRQLRAIHDSLPGDGGP